MGVPLRCCCREILHIGHIDECSNRPPVFAAAKDESESTWLEDNVGEKPLLGVRGIVGKSPIVEINFLIACIVDLDPVGILVVFVGNGAVVAVGTLVYHNLAGSARRLCQNPDKKADGKNKWFRSGHKIVLICS